MKVTVYTTPTCVYCHALLAWLDKKGIVYEEKLATDDSSIISVPVIDINETRIVGFDRPAIKKALKNAE